ncbi:MAG: DUF1697 domain-containing protein [Ruminococcus sp.]|nr:DUF1697 domain-containing protein [Ruminococcus sp.]
MKNIYLIFLRGVMPSGKNKVPMEKLREVLSKAGYPSAKTYLGTGNIILQSEKDSVFIADFIHTLILEEIGPDLSVIVRTPEEVEELLQHNPFNTENHDISRVFFTMLGEEPDIIRVQEAMSLFENGVEEQLQIIGKTAYMYIVGNAGRSKLSNNFLERKLKVSSTARNFNTLTKVVSISKGVLSAG